MKKRINFYLFLLIFAFSLTSCEEVIDIDLDSTAPTFVIEGVVTDQAAPFTVRIRKTVNFDEPNNYPNVSNAVVSISDGSQTLVLTETEPGIYQTAQAETGVEGRTYTLRVEAEGQVFEAQSTMPTRVAFENLQQGIGTQPRGGTTVLIIPVFTDPLGLGNYYRFVQWNNGQRLSNIFVLSDRDSDGLRVTRPLFAPGSDIETLSGDTVRVEMQSIDRATYKYLYALDASSGNGPNASVPANPDNNISGGALGYFSAHSVQIKEIIVQ